MRRASNSALLALFLSWFWTDEKARGVANASVKSRNRHVGRFEEQARRKRSECTERVLAEQDPKCRESSIDRENCVLRCMEPTCYERIYGGDPLEEGEVDVERGSSYRKCQKESMLLRERQVEEL